MNTARTKFKRSARFIVIIGDKNVRSEESARHGGVTEGEVGTNRLVSAVSRLLTAQDLELPIDAFIPGRVRTLFNTQVEREAMSVFACEFDTAWIETALKNGRFPTPTDDPTSPDYLFTRYGAILSKPDDEWLRTGLKYNNTATVLNAITPIYSADLLPDWERIVGIYDVGQAYQERINAVLVKLSETGGLSRGYFIRLAESLGYHITIDEPQPFRAGISYAGDRVYPENNVFVWVVNLPENQRINYYFVAGRSAAGEQLLSFGSPELETIFNVLKPAHTYIIFNYEG